MKNSKYTVSICDRLIKPFSQCTTGKHVVFNKPGALSWETLK